MTQDNAHLLQFINSQTSPTVREHGATIVGYLSHMRGKPHRSFMRLRERLNKRLENTRSGQEIAFIHATLGVLRRMHEWEETKDDHIVTDHAFCAVLRRTGVDLAKLKDNALQLAEKRGLRPVYAERMVKIKTFLPPLERSGK